MARFVFDRTALIEIARHPTTRDMLAEKGRVVLAAAKKNGAPIRRKGIYAKSFRLDMRLHKRGWEAEVVNTDWKASLIEYGSAHNPKHRVLGRALDTIVRT